MLDIIFNKITLKRESNVLSTMPLCSTTTTSIAAPPGSSDALEVPRRYTLGLLSVVTRSSSSRSPSTTTLQNQMVMRKRQQRSNSLMIICIVVAYGLCWTPYWMLQVSTVSFNSGSRSKNFWKITDIYRANIKLFCKPNIWGLICFLSNSELRQHILKTVKDDFETSTRCNVFYIEADRISI